MGAADHVHLLLSIPPQVTISRMLQWLKGKTAQHNGGTIVIRNILIGARGILAGFSGRVQESCMDTPRYRLRYGIARMGLLATKSNLNHTNFFLKNFQ